MHIFNAGTCKPISGDYSVEVYKDAWVFLIQIFIIKNMHKMPNIHTHRQTDIFDVSYFIINHTFVITSARISKKVEGGISIEKISIFNVYPALEGGGIT